MSEWIDVGTDSIRLSAPDVVAAIDRLTRAVYVLAAINAQPGRGDAPERAILLQERAEPTP